MRSRFEVLDAMRGVAALAVVGLHFHGLLAIHQPPAAYLAVDLFFVISGFVLAEAYEGRLAQGMSPWTFIKLRIIRLYPLYILSLGRALLPALVDVGRAGHWRAVDLASAFAGNALFLPSHASPEGWATPMPFVLNYPLWSLFFELVVNAVFAVTSRRLTTGRLLLLTLTLGVANLLVSRGLGTMNVGWQWHGFYGGFFRAGFGFFAGMLLHRLPRTELPRWTSLMVLAGVAFALTNGSQRFWYGALFVFLLAPASVYLAAASRPVFSIAARFLGAVSYGVYVLHEPLAALIDRAAVRWTGSRLELYAPWSGVGLVLLVIAAAAILDAAYDRPLRRWLSKRGGGGRGNAGGRMAAETPPY